MESQEALQSLCEQPPLSDSSHRKSVFRFRNLHLFPQSHWAPGHFLWPVLWMISNLRTWRWAELVKNKKVTEYCAWMYLIVNLQRIFNKVLWCTSDPEDTQRREMKWFFLEPAKKVKGEVALMKAWPSHGQLRQRQSTGEKAKEGGVPVACWDHGESLPLTSVCSLSLT